MAKVKKLIMKFRPPADADVAGYNLYVKPETAGPIDYLNTDPTMQYPGLQPGTDGLCQIDISAIPGLSGVDASYTFGLTAYDDVGNESDPLEGVRAVDFIVPAAPTEMTWVT